MIQDVLKNSNAADRGADILQLSETVSKEIQQFRKKAEQSVGKIPKMISTSHKTNAKSAPEIIAAAEKLSKTITKDYKAIMKRAWQRCVEIIGVPPCKSALLGLGSMARFEITPFSDFEHALITENTVDNQVNEVNMRYFRFLALLFQIILLNQGETVIRFLGVTCLNDCVQKNDWFYDDYTPCGISADSMVPFASKFPLGRLMKTPKKQFLTELIKRVDDMIEYLDGDITIKEGYHLSDILVHVCFFAGDLEVFKDYVEKVNRKLLSVEKKPFEESQKYAEEFHIEKLMKKSFFFAISQFEANFLSLLAYFASSNSRLQNRNI